MMLLGLIQRYDFTGLDLSARNLLDESFFDPPVDNKPAALHDKIDRGDLGVKTGKGFMIILTVPCMKSIKSVISTY